LLASALSAQVVKSDGPRPQFEVATVRPNKSGESGASLGPRAGGRLNGTNQTARNLIRNAFNVQPYQLIGGPGWMDSDRFDIVAKASDADLDAKGMLTAPQFMLRLQSLLEDRFKMVTRWENRELPVYALVLVTDGKLGPKLKVHIGECDRARGGAPPAPGPVAVNCGTRTNVTPTSGKVIGSGIRMETLD
jgi:bla regulator protein blaR1